MSARRLLARLLAAAAALTRDGPPAPPIPPARTATLAPPTVVTAHGPDAPPGPPPPPAPEAEAGDPLAVVEAKKANVDWRTRLLELEMEAQGRR